MGDQPLHQLSMTVLLLGLMLAATLVFMPLIIHYTSWAYRVMRGKVTDAHIREQDHAVY
jgi:cytochrome d ubiquinol oxidase subunit II